MVWFGFGFFETIFSKPYHTVCTIIIIYLQNIDLSQYYLNNFSNDKDSLNKIHGDSIILTGKYGFFSSLSGSDKNNRGFLNANFDYIIKTKNHSYQFIIEKYLNSY